MGNTPKRLDNAPVAYRITISDPELNMVFEEVATLRQYKTGSWGWHTAGKFIIDGTDGERAQVNVGLTVIDSKKWAD